MHEVQGGDSIRNLHRAHVAFINRSYWPDVEATGQLLTELCEDLSADFDVSVIAGPPNQYAGETCFRRSGWARRRGVRIRRIPCTQLSKASWIGRAVNYLSFFWMAAVAALKLPRPDILIVETDPPLLCFIGFLLQKLRRVKLVVYLQDIYPDLAIALGKLPDNVLTRWLRRAMFWVYFRADRIVVLSRDMRDLLVRSGVRASTISCIPNWIDTQKVIPVKQNNCFRQRHGLVDKFVVMYSGNLGQCQRLEDIVEAAGYLRHSTEILFLLVGDGAIKQRLVKQAAAQRLDNVHFLPYQPKEMLAESLSAADVHLVPVDPRVVNCLMPSKLYGVLSSGSPVLAVAPHTCELAELVERFEVGIVSPPGDSAKLAATIKGLASSREKLEIWGHRARQIAEQFYNRCNTTKSFAQMLQSLGGISVFDRVASTKSALTEVLHNPLKLTESASGIHRQSGNPTDILDTATIQG